jgi:hypothetical protein
MPTMIYAPGIKVYIESENDGTIDVSDDLVNGQMVRRSDGVSTFTFSLQNTRRKYDGVFTPNDRIVVLMKRLTWVQVFTGYLNSVPLMSAWPKVVNVSASCSLKRLQYWYWDPYSFAAYNLTVNSLLAVENGDAANTDGGLTNLILNVLDKVVGWPPSKVHIGRIPADWFKIAEDIARDIADEVRQADQVFAEYQKYLGNPAVMGGENTYVSGAAAGDLPAGTYAGIELDQGQANLALMIFNTGTTYKNITEKDIATALATAYAESTYHANATDGVSYGLFQQTPPWWGTKAECYDPNRAAAKFYERLLQVANRDKKSIVQSSYEVQRCAEQYKYRPGEYVELAYAIIAKLTNGVTTSQGNKTQGGQVGYTENQGVATGEAMASWAINMVQEHKHIRYSQATPNVNEYPPDFLDCSMLVRYVYYHVFGNNFGKLGAMRNASQIFSKCEPISVKDALLTPGAVIYKTNQHIELCIGGYQTVATNTTSDYARIRDYGPNSRTDDPDLDYVYSWYDSGGLLPGVQYPNIGSATQPFVGNSVTGAQPSSSYGSTTNATPAPGGQDDVFNSIFGRAGFAPIPVDAQQQRLSSSLTGIRALLNDQPLLGGFLKNVVNASLRSFCSAPNGDFIAWFPDYYGLWGTAAKMVVRPIEVQDFTVDWSDDFFVTHQFTVLGFLNQIDVATGESSVIFGGDANALAVATYGMANIDLKAIMEALFGIKATKEETDKFAAFIYRKFGARPDYQTIDGMIADADKRAEFFSALYLFMRQWAYQYNAQVPLTFMPELWPGMLLQIPEFDFQAYITTVTHSFSFGEGGAFTTQVNLAAPARLPKSEGGKANQNNANTLIGLPVAGGFTPGMTPEEARRALRPQFESEPEPKYTQPQFTPPGIV